MESQRPHAWARVLILAAAVAAATQCTPSRPASQRAGGAVQSDLAVAAQKTYVAPGDLDQYYMFSSGAR
jgi:nitrous-oxide reductase